MIEIVPIIGRLTAVAVSADRRAEAAEKRVKDLERALEPFALASLEGVIKPASGHVSITTCAEYFHRARDALERAALYDKSRQGQEDKRYRK